MVASLHNISQNHRLLIEDLKIATSFKDRAIGLLGHSSLGENQALWIHHCNSIHTLFMRFAIDCIFINKKMEVVAIKKDVRPWRLVMPSLRASSVIEMPSGLAEKLEIQIGDQLYVGN